MRRSVPIPSGRSSSLGLTASSSTSSPSTGPDAPPPSTSEIASSTRSRRTPRSSRGGAPAPPRPHDLLARRHRRLDLSRVPEHRRGVRLWKQITRFSLWSLLAMAGLQAASLASLWALQFVTLHAPRRPAAVITSQLAGNGLAKVAPGGGAVVVRAAVGFLVCSGAHPAATVTALTAINVLVFAMPAGDAGAGHPGAAPRRRERHALAHGVRRPGRVRGSERARRGVAHHGPPAGVGRARRTGCPQPPARARPSRCTTCRSGCCASATGCWRRSGRAGSARCWPPSDAGRSTTSHCSQRSPRSARTRGRASSCSRSAARRCSRRSRSRRAGSASSRPA